MFGLTLASILLPREESCNEEISIGQNGTRLDQVRQGDRVCQSHHCAE